MRREIGWVFAGLSLVVAGVAAACGGAEQDGLTLDGSNGDDTGLNPGDDAVGDGIGAEVGDRTIDSVFFDPEKIDLVIDDSGPKTASYAFKAKMSDGSTMDVFAESLQFNRPDVAKLDISKGIQLVASGPWAGSGKLLGIYKGREAKATLNVTVKMKEVATGIDPAIVALLDGGGFGADSAVTGLLAPYDKTIFPLGLSAPLMMWNGGGPDDTYRLAFEQSNFSYTSYFKAPAPARARATQKAWDAITTSNVGDPIVVTLSRFDATKKTPYKSATQQWTIAPESLRGAIYYWTTSKGGHLARIQPGSGSAPTTVYGGKCVGCHAVSADGKTLVGSVEGVTVTDGTGDNRAWASFDLPDEKLRSQSAFFSGILAVNPNGKWVVFGSQKLRLANAATGLAVAAPGLDDVKLDAGMVGMMTPAFSPDGKMLAAVEGNGTWYHNLKGGKLVTLDFDETLPKFSNFQTYAAASELPGGQQVLAYPSFTPDSASIAFHATNDPDGRNIGALYLESVKLKKMLRLATLSDGAPVAGDRNVSLEPTFNPIKRGGYFWVVFTSSRTWGNKITGTPSLDQERLWVAAIDADFKDGVDPSHPPFFLEGQEEDTKNRRGFWTLAPCMKTEVAGKCGAGFECCSGFCDAVAAKCIDPKTLSCKAVGEACAAAGECCNPTAVDCVDGKCKPLGPK